MRFAVLFLSVIGTGCITGALHEAAFPEGYEYEFPLDADWAAPAGRGFRICFRTRTGSVELELKPAGSEIPATTGLPFSAIDSTVEEPVWTTTAGRGCRGQGVAGIDLPVGSLLFSSSLALLPGQEKRSAASAALPGQAMPLSVEISRDRKRLRIVTHEGQVILRPASFGEFDPGFAPYDENQWIPDREPAGQQWEPLELQNQRALNVYYRDRDGRLRLKAFPVTDLAINAVVYVPHLFRNPKEERCYLLPLYPFALLLDGVTLVLQGVIWFEDAKRGRACAG